jgi:hypothetical protein
MKTSELTGAALDWAVAMAENWAGADFEVKPYSTDWSQGGPIIERKLLAISRGGAYSENFWRAAISYSDNHFYGPTPLIAAMRCHVASELGDEIDLPKELT